MQDKNNALKENNIANDDSINTHHPIRELHGITDYSNPVVTAVKTAVMGNGFRFLPR